jgi:hypothetical protein
VVTGLLFGLAPAVQALKADLHETLKEGGRGAGGSLRRNWLRSALVVAQMALSLVLLISASLFVRSFLKLQEEKGGFDTSRLMTMRFYMPAGRYEEDEEMSRRVQDVVRRVETVPGIETVSASNNISLGGGGGSGRILVEGKDFPRGEEPNVFYTGVTPHFFQAIGLQPTSGRSFTDQEGFALSGVIALFLASIGVYGVLSYSVSQRVREIGVRVALGAQNGDVTRLVLRQGMILALLGIGVGLPFSFGAGRVVASVLYDTSPNDPVSFAGISAALAAIAALASWLPARRPWRWIRWRRCAANDQSCPLMNGASRR